MKTLEEIKAMRDELAEAHAQQVYIMEPYGVESDSAKDFLSGFDAALELMLQRERVVNVCFDGVISLLKEDKKFDTEFVIDFIQKALNALNN